MRKLAIALLFASGLFAGAWFLSHAGASKKQFVSSDQKEPTSAATTGQTESHRQSSDLSKVAAQERRPPLSDLYRDIDRHALKTPKDAEQSIDSLAKHLVGPGKNEREKVRAIFRWVADRIAYDVDGLRGLQETDSSAAAVLETRKGLCGGYSNLFEALCISAGIEAVVVYGHGKGEPGEDVADNHAWNAVKIDGAWHLLDVTWCAGTVTDNCFCKQFTEAYYLPMPEQMILDHFPTDPEWQLLTPAVSAPDYKELLKLERGMRPFGALHRELVEKRRHKTFRGFVTLIDPHETRYVVRQAPLGKHLQAGSRHTFRIDSSDFVDVAVLTGGAYRVLPRKGSTFEGEVVMARGMVLVCVKRPGQINDAYWPILEYAAE